MAEFRASVVGFMLLLAFFIGGWFSGDFMGFVLEHSGRDGCARAFAIMAGVYLAAAVLMAVSFFFTFRRDRLVAK